MEISSPGKCSWAEDTVSDILMALRSKKKRVNKQFVHAESSLLLFIVDRTDVTALPATG